MAAASAPCARAFADHESVLLRTDAGRGAEALQKSLYDSQNALVFVKAAPASPSASIDHDQFNTIRTRAPQDETIVICGGEDCFLYVYERQTRHGANVYDLLWRDEYHAKEDADNSDTRLFGSSLYCAAMTRDTMRRHKMQNGQAGFLVVTGGGDAMVAIWLVVPGRTEGVRLQTYCHGKSVHGVDITLDGRTIASGSDDGTIRIYLLGQDREYQPHICLGERPPQPDVLWKSASTDIDKFPFKPGHNIGSVKATALSSRGSVLVSSHYSESKPGSFTFTSCVRLWRLHQGSAFKICEISDRDPLQTSGDPYNWGDVLPVAIAELGGEPQYFAFGDSSGVLHKPFPIHSLAFFNGSLDFMAGSDVATLEDLDESGIDGKKGRRRYDEQLNVGLNGFFDVCSLRLQGDAQPQLRREARILFKFASGVYCLDPSSDNRKIFGGCEDCTVRIVSPKLKSGSSSSSSSSQPPVPQQKHDGAKPQASPSSQRGGPSASRKRAAADDGLSDEDREEESEELRTQRRRKAPAAEHVPRGPRQPSAAASPPAIAPPLPAAAGPAAAAEPVAPAEAAGAESAMGDGQLQQVAAAGEAAADPEPTVDGAVQALQRALTHQLERRLREEQQRQLEEQERRLREQHKRQLEEQQRRLREEHGREAEAALAEAASVQARLTAAEAAAEERAAAAGAAEARAAQLHTALDEVRPEAALVEPLRGGLEVAALRARVAELEGRLAGSVPVAPADLAGLTVEQLLDVQRRLAQGSAALSSALNAALQRRGSGHLDTQCMKCTERPRSVLLQPCRHIVLCEGCYDAVLAAAHPQPQQAGPSEPRPALCPKCRLPFDEGATVRGVFLP
eukprot:tig00000396_g24875.t1